MSTNNTPLKDTKVVSKPTKEENLIELFNKAIVAVNELAKKVLEKEKLSYSFNVTQLTDLKKKFIEPILKKINYDNNLQQALEEHLGFDKTKSKQTLLEKLQNISNSIEAVELTQTKPSKGEENSIFLEIAIKVLKRDLSKMKMILFDELLGTFDINFLSKQKEKKQQLKKKHRLKKKNKEVKDLVSNTIKIKK